MKSDLCFKIINKNINEIKARGNKTKTNQPFEGAFQIRELFQWRKFADCRGAFLYRETRWIIKDLQF